ncbi:MAG TPA: thiamine-phosphate kinase [Candidatus Competibacteraceae bacterium]|nr:thiamine-phosphate kinase [Candidatus Competibacteraceae bacterium]
MGEFELIRRYFQRALTRPDVILGVGDDCALLRVPTGQELAVSLDLLVGGRHFLADADPEGVGYKALAVNLSDLAAMGAEPAWATLGLTLPAADEQWLRGFCHGFYTLAEQHDVALVGGDTTRGPLAIAVQVHGFVPPGQALRRAGARPGDRILVTGTPGDAGLALRQTLGQTVVAAEHHDYLRRRLDRPTPRIAQGLALRGLASAAIDVSDGLAQDLGHILAASGVGATLWLARLPLSAALRAVPAELAWDCALSGGDDYELCLTVSPERLERVLQEAAGWDCPLTEIGVIELEPGLRCLRPDGTLYRPERVGYDHFA